MEKDIKTIKPPVESEKPFKTPEENARQLRKHPRLCPISGVCAKYVCNKGIHLNVQTYTMRIFIYLRMALNEHTPNIFVYMSITDQLFSCQKYKHTKCRKKNIRKNL